MAWHVVIAGGGFGGFYAARHARARAAAAERARSRSSATSTSCSTRRCCPARPAGTLEPRHVVVPLREALRAHRPAPRRTSPAPTRTATSSASSRSRAAPRSSATTSSSSRSARSRGRCRCPGWPSTAIGFKTLPDAIELRNRLLRTLEAAETLEDPAERAGAADVRLRRRRLRRARGPRRAAGLRRRRDRPLPALPHAGHALDPRRGDRPGDARDLADARGVRRAASCAAAASRSAPSTTLEELTPTTARLSDGEVVPTRTLRVDGRRPAASGRRAARPAARRQRPDRGRQDDARRRPGERVGDRRRRGGARPGEEARAAVAADRAARDAPGPARRAQRRRGARHGPRPAVHATGRSACSSTWARARRWPRRWASVARAHRLVAGPHATTWR